MGLPNTEQKRNSGLISAGLVMLLVLATPLAYAQDLFCGDGIFNPDNTEQCDDGNNVDGDGCSSICLIEPPPPVCGDGILHPDNNEQCDDSNNVDGDGCSSTCLIEPPPPVCGDGILHPDNNEQCDDSNNVDGDGCSSTCLIEPPPPVCGDGILHPDNNEQCDDSNNVDGDGCSSTCLIEPPPPVCGDGILHPDNNEQCDDSNNVDGDGCSSICQVEPNFPPTASNVLISGTPHVGQVLAGSYDYADSEGDLQGASTFRWLHTDGEVDIPIDGATALTYTLVAADEGALIKFEVTPVAQSGPSPGEAASAVVGPVVGRPDFTPPINLPPTASNVLIAGSPRVGQVLTGSYTYADAESDLQGTSIFRWLRNNVAIAGATARSYALVAADEGTLISFKITPVAQSGPSPGLPASSPPVGPVTPVPSDRATASDLELISLTATPEVLTVNGQLTYTITVRNNGPAAATGVHVIDALPAGATPVAAEGPADSSQGQCTGTPSSGPQPQALTVRCDLETLDPGAEATVTINVMPTVPGDLINTAQVAASEIDPNPANNSKTQTTTVRSPDPAEADLAVEAVVDPTANGFKYTLTVTNHGPATATGVQLTNDLPRGLDQITASQGSCSVTDPMLCALGELTSGEVETVTIDVIREVDADTLPNRAAVNRDQHDPNTANNSALTSALELPTPRTACNSTRCTLRLTCNRSDLLRGGICENQIKLFVDTRARRDMRARRLSDERASGPRLVRFAAAVSHLPGGQTKNVRFQLTPKGKNLARTLTGQGKNKLRAVMEISNHVGGTDIIPRITVRLK